MIKVTAFYPNEEGKKFDMAYYFKEQLPTEWVTLNH